ncbi:MAG: hypothetical protein AB1640_13040 [bacterium]
MMRSDSALKKLTLEDVRERFEEWRRKRRRRAEPIPEELWAAAVRLTKEHSVVQVSKILRLDYTKLKRRASPEGSPRGPKLVEVDLCPPETPAGQCFLEVEEPHGRRLKLALKGKVDLDVLAVIRSMWGEGS